MESGETKQTYEQNIPGSDIGQFLLFLTYFSFPPILVFWSLYIIPTQDQIEGVNRSKNDPNIIVEYGIKQMLHFDYGLNLFVSIEYFISILNLYFLV